MTDTIKLGGKNNIFYISGDSMSNTTKTAILRAEMKKGRYEITTSDQKVEIVKLKAEAVSEVELGSVFCRVGYIANKGVEKRLIGENKPFFLRAKWLLDSKGNKVGIAVRTEDI